MGLKKEDVIFPENAQLYVAMGASLLAENEKSQNISDIIENIEKIGNIYDETQDKIEVLFKDEKDYLEFVERHKKNSVKMGNLSEYRGGVFLGIDAGSTSKRLFCFGSLKRDPGGRANCIAPLKGNMATSIDT